jgi:hypothetical protein
VVEHAGALAAEVLRGSGHFAVPPGVRAGGYWGEALFS